MASEDSNLHRFWQLSRQLFDEENSSMTQSERDELRKLWNRIGSKLNNGPVSASLPALLVPQKRPVSDVHHFGLEPRTKRSVPASLPHQSAPHFERRISAPSGSPTADAKAPSYLGTPARSQPIDIPHQPMRSGRRASTSMASHQRRSHNRKVYNPTGSVAHPAFLDFLGQSPDHAVQATPAFALTVPDAGHGEWHAPDMSLFTATAGLNYDGTYSPVTATSDSCLTTGSTAFSEPMSRCNTNDQICEPFGMFNMDPSLASFSDESMAVMTKAPYRASYDVSSHVDFSQVPLSHAMPHFSSFSVSSTMMKPSPSQESVSSSSSESVSFVSPLSFPLVAQQAQVKPRVLAPKQDDASAQNPMPKIVAIKGEDGTIKHKAEIARTTRQPQQRKTTFCDFCHDQPQGFHGDHELRRHIERQHTQYRKVWVCRDVSEDGTFLRNCKACRNNKTYGANYNAAAHLRRTHFNPCKNRRGGRNKKSEGRGGMGGGNSPSMEELKKWMFETYELNIHGRVIVQNVAPDANLPQVPMAELTAFDHVPLMGDNLDFDFDHAAIEHSPIDNTLDTMGAHQQPSMMHGYQQAMNQPQTQAVARHPSHQNVSHRGQSYMS